MPLYVKLRLREEDFIKDEEIYMGDIPMVTERGSFIINGAERVVVSQLHRSPGICFEKDFHASGKELFAFRIIPDRGTWLEVQFDNNDLLYVYLDRRRRRRKFLITTLLRSIGYSSDLDILNLFYEIKDLKVAKALDMENVSTLVLVEDAIDAQKGVVLARAFEPLTKQIVRTFEKHDISVHPRHRHRGGRGRDHPRAQEGSRPATRRRPSRKSTSAKTLHLSGSFAPPPALNR